MLCSRHNVAELFKKMYKISHYKLHFFNARLRKKWRRPHLKRQRIPSNDLALLSTPHHLCGRRQRARQKIAVSLTLWMGSWRVPHSWGAGFANGEMSSGDASTRRVPASRTSSSTTPVRRGFTASMSIWSWHQRTELTPWGTSRHDGRKWWWKILPAVTAGNLQISKLISLSHSGRIKMEFRN